MLTFRFRWSIQNEQSIADILCIYNYCSCLSAGLVYLGIKGKGESESSDHSGKNYYIGSFMVAAVFALIGILTAAFIVITYNDGETSATVCIKILASLCQIFGFLVCIVSIVFVVRFGIQNCKDTDSRSDNCSYDKNIEVNYTLAVISLVIIILLLLSLSCSACLNYIEADLQKEDRDMSRKPLLRHKQHYEIVESDAGLREVRALQHKGDLENQTDFQRSYSNANAANPLVPPYTDSNYLPPSYDSVVYGHEK